MVALYRELMYLDAYPKSPKSRGVRNVASSGAHLHRCVPRVRPQLSNKNKSAPKCPIRARERGPEEPGEDGPAKPARGARPQAQRCALRPKMFPNFPQLNPQIVPNNMITHMIQIIRLPQRNTSPKCPHSEFSPEQQYLQKVLMAAALGRPARVNIITL